MVQKLKRSKKLIIVNHPREVLLGASGLLENSSILLLQDSDSADFANWKRWLMGVCKDLFIPLYTCGLSDSTLQSISSDKLKNCISVAPVGGMEYVIFARDNRTEKAISEQFSPGNSQIKGLLSFSLEAHDTGIIVPSKPEIIDGYSGLGNPYLMRLKNIVHISVNYTDFSMQMILELSI